ncbi:alpha,alpha-trehalase nth1 [Kickxella alabastrina]|nr:alpha,alpha-trehalase nth1 [Kickxella alabastrina]
MHILSSIKQHVTSTAHGSRKAAPSEGNEEQQQKQQYHGSLRKALSSGKDSSKPKPQRPCPPITIHTKDISWPIGSGNRETPRLDDDLVSTRELRLSSATVAGSFEKHNVSPGLSTIGYSGSRGDALALSHPRAVSASKNRQQLPFIHTQCANTTASLGSCTAESIRSADGSLRTAISASASIAAPNSPLATAYIRRSYSNESASMPISPVTPTSAFSFVSVQSPISLKSPAHPTFVESGGRLRRAGTLNGLNSSSSKTPSEYVAASRRNRHIHSSYNSLVLSQSTTPTVVSSSSSLGSSNRPTSTDSLAADNNRNSRNNIKRSPKKPPADDDELRGPPPRDDWDIVFDRIKEYRATHEAPVDTVGCEALGAEEKDPKLQRFRTLISLMLSAQTKDEITAEAVHNLSQRLPGGLTPKALSEAQTDLIHECVRRVGFWQRKSGYIKEAARTCLEQHDGDIPRTVTQLLSLPGVGPKMAYLAMQAAWQDNQGIGVDTHVLRISHRLGWVSDLARTPEATRHALESWMPKSLWREINPLLVGLGQTVCRGVGPKCGECPVSQYCPSAQMRRRSASLRDGRGSTGMHSQKGAFGGSSELSDVDVEDLASMVRGAEQAVRSRKTSGGRSRQVVAKTEFPEIPESPVTKTRRDDGADGTTSDGYRARARSRAFSLRYLRPIKIPSTMSDADAGNDSHASAGMSDTELTSNTRGGASGDGSSSGRSPKPELTPATSQYFMRSRSNAASELVRPEAKTATVRNARAKVCAKKLYSRRLSKSDMQWALGEDWDPESSSSLSDSDLADEKHVSDAGDNLNH